MILLINIRRCLIINVLIKDIPKEERPRERLINYGVSNLSNEELISIIFSSGTKDLSVKDVSNLLLKEINDITELKDVEIGKLLAIKGIGIKKAASLLASIELGKRVYTRKEKNKIQIKNSKDIYDVMSFLINEKQENFYVLYLDNKKQIITKKRLYVGTINKSIAHPREIFKYAYLNSACFIVCVHNHPTLDPAPSNEDVELTNHLINIGKLNNIHLLDHIIIGDGYYSFFEDTTYKL